jgi:hypothetical protein
VWKEGRDIINSSANTTNIRFVEKLSIALNVIIVTVRVLKRYVCVVRCIPLVN